MGKISKSKKKNKSSQGNQSHFQSSGNKSSGQQPKAEEKKKVFQLQEGGKSSGPTFASVKEDICHKIQKNSTSYPNGYDLTQSIRDGTYVDLTKLAPVRQIAKVSKTKTPDAIKMEQDGYDMMFKIDYEQHSARLRDFENNKKTAYSYIWDNYCVKAMRNRIEEHPDYASLVNDPLKLLEAIKVLTMQPVRAQYSFVTMTQVLRNFLLMRQRDNEELNDYVKRFKEQCDEIKKSLGEEFLNDFVKTTKEYQAENDPAKARDLQKAAFEQWTAYMLLNSVNRQKFGPLLRQLGTNFSLKDDKYPKTITAAVEALRGVDQQWIQVPTRKPNYRKNNKLSSNTQGATNPGPKSLTFAQQPGRPYTVICFKCGVQGHIATECPRNDIPRDQWYSRRAMNSYQGEGDSQPNVGTQDDPSALSEPPNTQTRRSASAIAGSQISSGTASQSDQHQQTGRQFEQTPSRSGGQPFQSGWCSYAST